MDQEMQLYCVLFVAESLRSFRRAEFGMSPGLPSLLDPHFFFHLCTERRRRDAISAATCLTEALVDHLNVGYEILTVAWLTFLNVIVCERRLRQAASKQRHVPVFSVN